MLSINAIIFLHNLRNSEHIIDFLNFIHTKLLKFILRKTGTSIYET